jgi:hypothetical protein
MTPFVQHWIIRISAGIFPLKPEYIAYAVFDDQDRHLARFGSTDNPDKAYKYVSKTEALRLATELNNTPFLFSRDGLRFTVEEFKVPATPAIEAARDAAKSAAASLKTPRVTFTIPFGLLDEAHIQEKPEVDWVVISYWVSSSETVYLAKPFAASDGPLTLPVQSYNPAAAHLFETLEAATTQAEVLRDWYKRRPVQTSLIRIEVASRTKPIAKVNDAEAVAPAVPIPPATPAEPKVSDFDRRFPHVLKTADAFSIAKGSAHNITLYDLLSDQKRWSIKTFGPIPQRGNVGASPKTVIAHLKKEMPELEERPDALEEWLDFMLLSFDGAMRAGHSPRDIVLGLLTKLHINKYERKWPDYRKLKPGEPSEHLRKKHKTPSLRELLDEIEDDVEDNEL